MRRVPALHPAAQRLSVAADREVASDDNRLGQYARAATGCPGRDSGATGSPG